MVLWHSAPDETGLVSNLSFLLSRHGNHSTAISKLSEGNEIFLDGPYGKDLGLTRVDVVVLAGKGMGIAGVLPLALDITLRRQHDTRIKTRIQEIMESLQQQSDEELSKEVVRLRSTRLFRDATRKVILFWSLDNNSQMEWVETQLRALQLMDPQNVSITPNKLGVPNDV
jgi:hypothetical protein